MVAALLDGGYFKGNIFTCKTQNPSEDCGAHQCWTIAYAYETWVLENIEIMTEEQNSILSSISQDMKGLKDSVDSLKSTVNGLEDKIMSNIRGVIREETRKFDNEIELMKGRMDNMESRFMELTGESTNSPHMFDCNTSVIVINLVQHADEDPAAVCQGLFSDVLEIDVTVAKAERLKSRNDKPGIIKCQLANLQEKIDVLRNKKNVRNDDTTKNVFIARMKSHEERLIEINVKALLKELPNGNQFRFTGSGRLVDKRVETQDTDNEGGPDNCTNESGARAADGMATWRTQTPRGGSRRSQQSRGVALVETEASSSNTRNTRGSVDEGSGRRSTRYQHGRSGNRGGPRR